MCHTPRFSLFVCPSRECVCGVCESVNIRKENSLVLPCLANKYIFIYVQNWLYLYMCMVILNYIIRNRFHMFVRMWVRIVSMVVWGALYQRSAGCHPYVIILQAWVLRDDAPSREADCHANHTKMNVSRSFTHTYFSLIMRCGCWLQRICRIKHHFVLK